MTDENVNLYAHAPLPYIVTIRAAVSEDAEPERFERRVVAYSLYEAMFSAVIEVTGSASLDNSRCVVESVKPDTLEWTRLMVMKAMAKRETQ